MKRTPVFLLIGVVLLIALTACDMNLWVSSRAIEVDKTAATTAVTSIKSKSNAMQGDGDDRTLVALTPDNRNDIVAELAQAMNNETGRALVLEELGKPAAGDVAEAAQAVLLAAKQDVNDAVDGLEESQQDAIRALLPIIPEDTVLTEADVLNIQLINSMASTVIEIVNKSKAHPNEDISPEDYKPLIKEALDIVDIVKGTASSANIDMLANVDIAALMKQFMPGGAT